MNWNDLRYVLALHRSGTLTAAAKALGVNHATVSRRIDSLESELGASLFTKTQDGWELTALGESLIGPVRALEESALRVERIARSAEPDLDGVVCIAASQLLNNQIVVPAAAAMADEEPGLRLDVLEGADFVSLARQEADLALRLTRKDLLPGGPSVRMTKLCAVPWAMCAHRSLIEAYEIEPPLEAPGDLPVAIYNRQAPSNPDRRWLEGTEAPNVVYSSNSMYGVQAAVRGGLAVGLIPRAYAVGDVVAVSPTLLEMDAWLAIHPDLHESPRIRFAHDFIRDWVADNPGLFAD